MSRTRGHPSDPEEFHLIVEVPVKVRHDPVQLRAWLETMAVEMVNAEEVEIEQSADRDTGPDSGDWVQIKMMVRPCGPKFSMDGDDQDDDSPGDDDSDDFGDGYGDDARS